MTLLDKQEINIMIGKLLNKKIKVFKDEVVDLQVENEKLREDLTELIDTVKLISKELVKLMGKDEKK